MCQCHWSWSSAGHNSPPTLPLLPHCPELTYSSRHSFGIQHQKDSAGLPTGTIAFWLLQRALSYGMFATPYATTGVTELAYTMNRIVLWLMDGTTCNLLFVQMAKKINYEALCFLRLSIQFVLDVASANLDRKEYLQVGSHLLQGFNSRNPSE